MKFGGRVQAAIEVLSDITDNHTPLAQALRDWGKSHRFAGSKDRSFIGILVHDALRTRASSAWRMGEDTPRAIILGTLVWSWGETPDSLSTAFAEDTHSPKPISKSEHAALGGFKQFMLAPAWIQADIPEWCWPMFSNNFDEEAVFEGAALAKRPPLDLRVNTLKTDRETALAALKPFGAQACQISPIGIRIPPGTRDERLPNIQSEEIFLTGGVDIQDEGSQIVSLLIDAKPGETVLDYCAGGGGKSLAVAGDMQDQGRLYAYDIDKRRLAPLYQRAQRAGAQCINIIQPPIGGLDGLKTKMDRVLVDAPCTGSGTWRRKPDAKWRLSPQTLELRMSEQQAVLEQAKAYVKPGGFLFYITCSVFAEENENQIYGFLEANSDYELLSAGEVFEDRLGVNAPKPWSEDGCTVTLTPATTDTDGFFFAVVQRQG